jgi:hypothetical protein
LPTTDEAKEAALLLRSRIIESGRIDVDEESPSSFLPSYNHSATSSRIDNANNSMLTGSNDGGLLPVQYLDPSLAVERLYERRGKMFGVLVCKRKNQQQQQQADDDDPNDDDNDVVILKAYAGKLGGRWNLPGWAPIIGKVPESLPVFNRISAEVTEIFGTIHNIATNSSIQETRGRDADVNYPTASGVGDEGASELDQDQTQIIIGERVKQLTKDRARLANLALEEVRRHQLVTNFRGETYPITAIYSRGPTKLPGGVGDCAAPKLLAEAARLGLRPTGIAEIFIGATGGMSTTKGDGELYDACEQRCEQIAGFMLCGLHDDVAEENSTPSM